MGRGLHERAEVLAEQVQMVTNFGAGMMLPGSVRALIEEMAKLLRDMAREIEKGKS